MNESFDYDVFLSDSSKHEAAVRALAERLKSDGMRVRPVDARFAGKSKLEFDGSR